jgi:hypothetical protein
MTEPGSIDPGSVVLVAGVRYEAEKSKRRTEMVRVRFESRGRVMVPALALPVDDWGPAGSSSAGVNGA